MTSKWLRKPPETPGNPGKPLDLESGNPAWYWALLCIKNTIWCILQDQAVAFVCENTVFLCFVLMLAFPLGRPNSRDCDFVYEKRVGVPSSKHFCHVWQSCSLRIAGWREVVR